VLTVAELVVEENSLPTGVYTSSEPWLEGKGYVVVGKLKYVDVEGTLKAPGKTFAADQVAVLKGPTTFELDQTECVTTVITGSHPLAIAAGSEATWSGFVTGAGPVQIAAASDRQALTISGRVTNSYQGETVLTRGVLKLNKPQRALAIPGNLTLGGSVPENLHNGVIWQADGQLAPTATITLQGTQPSYLDLNGHQARLSKVLLSKAAQIRTGKGGGLRLQQLFIDGRRIRDGEYTAERPWLTGTGTVVVDSRVEIQGAVGAPEAQIGLGNIASLTGDTKFAYPASGCPVDIVTNGHTLVLDSGNGNAFSLTGSVSGTGNIEFFMGPSYTDHKDTPLPIAGDRSNTTTGKYFVRKGRVQLEKSKGVDAISGDVYVGGQGFNDCLFWKQSDQLKDRVHITLIDVGSNGAAYLDLNGCSETAASLTLTAKNRVKTTSPDGISGQLAVKALTLDGANLPAGRYTSENAKWVTGGGAVVVAP
jgi:hypothetical protein